MIWNCIDSLHLPSEYSFRIAPKRWTLSGKFDDILRSSQCETLMPHTSFQAWDHRIFFFFKLFIFSFIFIYLFFLLIFFSLDCNDCLFAWIFKWPRISLCYKRYWGTNTSFIFCNFHSIAKPLTHFVKCLTINYSSHLKNCFMKKLENQDILSMYKKFNKWLSKSVSHLISNWDDIRNI